MLVTLIPMFDENMAVGAYSLFTQKNNCFLNPSAMGTGQNDGAGNIGGLEVIESMGMDTLSDDKPIFVELNNISVFSDIDSQCSAPHRRIVLIIDDTITPTDNYINRFIELKKDGYRLAIKKLPVSKYEAYAPVLKHMDYILINDKTVPIDKAKLYFEKVYPDISVIACNITSMERFQELKHIGGFALYEGEFYRLPVTMGQKEVAPLKINYVHLLGLMNDYNFELTQAADVISRDTALTISLLKMVNRMALNSEITTIRYAAAMLGQKELKRWATTAIVKNMCSDKPNEITRFSLLRARYAENLSKIFNMADASSELFLMGLFSVIDIIMDKPMEEALTALNVSANIKNALIHHTGRFAKVLEFMEAYERADWSEVSRLMVIENISMGPVYEAYLDALRWYRNLTKE